MAACARSIARCKAFVDDDPRLVGVGLLVFEDPERSAAELDRALAEGLRLFMIPYRLVRPFAGASLRMIRFGRGWPRRTALSSSTSAAASYPSIPNG